MDELVIGWTQSRHFKNILRAFLLYQHQGRHVLTLHETVGKRKKKRTLLVQKGSLENDRLSKTILSNPYTYRL